MIRQLVREQLRANRTSVMWTTLLLALALGLAASAAFVAAQRDATVDYVTAARGMDGAWAGTVELHEGSVSAGTGSSSLTPQQLDAAVQRAGSEGAQVAAVLDTELFVLPEPSWPEDGPREPLYAVSAATGAVGWDTLLVSGAAPGEGEITVDASWAASHAVEVGDDVTVAMIDDDAAAEFLAQVTVSGLLRTTATGGYEVSQEQMLLDWDTAWALDQEASAVDGHVWHSQASLSAAQETPALAALDALPGWRSYWAYSAGGWSLYFWLASLTLVCGLFGMAFAVGRAQAQVRSGWVATARALGATRLTVVLATVVEALTVGIVAGLLGVAGAGAAVALHWASVVASNPDALLPGSFAVPVPLALALVAASVVVAGIIGAIPAFWAARVTPAVALRPETPVGEAPLSRTVHVWPLLAMWLLSMLGLLALVHGIPGVSASGADSGTVTFLPAAREGVLGTARWFILPAAAVTTAAVLVEATRRLVRRSSLRLQASRRPGLLAAGAALRGRPALATAPSAVLALASTLSVYYLATQALHAWAIAGEHEMDVSPYWSWAGPFSFATGSFVGYRETIRMTAVIVAVLVLVAFAAFAAGRSAQRAESTAQVALGLDTRAARTAGSVQFGLPLVLGAALGALAGVCGAVLLFSYQAHTYSDLGDVVDQFVLGPGWAIEHLAHATVPVAACVLTVLAAIAAGSLLAAATTRTSRRLAERVAA